MLHFKRKGIIIHVIILTTMKYDVFISYRWKSSIHQADALESKLKLKRKGIRVYLDREENRGEDWKKKMNERIMVPKETAK